MAKKTGTEIITVQVSRVKNTSDTFSVYLALIEDGPLPFPITVKQFAGLGGATRDRAGVQEPCA